MLAAAIRDGWSMARAEWARRPFFRNVSIMMAGAVGGQAITLLVSPLLTRLYTPESFGVLGVYSAVLGILVVVSALRYEMAIPLTETREDALNLAAVCFAILILVVTIGGLLLLFTPVRWLVVLQVEALAPYLALVPIGIFCQGAYFIMLYVATRQESFEEISRTRLLQGAFGSGSQLALGLTSVGPLGLVVGYIISQSTGVLGLLRATLVGHGSAFRHISLARMLVLAGRFRRFPLVASWAALIDAAGANSVLYILLSANVSARVAGYVFLAERVVWRPLLILGTSLLQVFIGEAGRTARTDPAALQRRFRQVTGRQFLIALAWVLLANVAAGYLFSPIFGQQWADAVVYLHAISVAYLAQAIVQPVFHTLQLLERQGLAATWQIGRLLLVILTFFVAVKAGLSAPFVVLTYACAQGVACLILFLLIARAIGQVQR